MKGYSYRVSECIVVSEWVLKEWVCASDNLALSFLQGVLCVLLQNAGNVCDDESNASLFTLIATNPLTGKHTTLTSLNCPDQHKQQ